MLEKIICSESNTLRDALSIINDNGKGICFVVKKNNLLIGILTDGDIRRAILNNCDIDSSVTDYMNKDYFSLPIDSDIGLIVENLLNERIKVIPLCNSNGQVVDFADQENFHSIPILSPAIEGNELKYLTDCVRTNWISSQGKYVKKFENIFNELHPDYNSLAVSSGTTALHLSLATLGISEGDEVIVPNITFAATINAVIYCNATPVICEINQENWCIDIDSVRNLISNKTKAIIPVHLYGQPCDMSELVKIANLYNIFLIEDCAEAVGTKINNRRVGTFGDCATFSFFGNKTITTGEGGMVLFRNKSFYEKAKLLRDHGMSKKKKYWHEIVGFNFRMTNLQAAVGVAQMERFDQIIESKQEIFDFYNKKLKNKRGIKKLPANSKEIFNSSWLFTIILDEKINRDSLIHNLKENGIELRPTFSPLSEMPPYKEFRKSNKLFNSIFLSNHGVSLPSSPILQKIQLEHIVKIFLEELNYLS